MIGLCGSTGFVGSAFVRFFQNRNLPFVPIPSAQLRDANSARTALQQSGITRLINCAGFTGKPNVDACEHQKAECLQGNAVFPGLLRQACLELGLPWGHVSSGCIFTGDQGPGGDGQRLGFSETDPPNFSFRQNNCSFYSGTKALGEEALGFSERKTATAVEWHSPHPDEALYIWRLRIPFSEVDSPRNYLTKLMRYERLLEARNSISHLDEFVRACWECFEKQVPFGIYHVTNPGSITTHEIVEMIRRAPVGQALESSGKTFSFFKSESEFMDVAAITPRSNCVLDSSKLASVGIHLTPVHQAVQESLRMWKSIPSL
jgi:dTDP-4-dehydrorhamnose reductase